MNRLGDFFRCSTPALAVLVSITLLPSLVSALPLSQEGNISEEVIEQSELETQLEFIRSNRIEVENEIFFKWTGSYADGGEQLRSTLPHVSDMQLLSAKNAISVAELEEVLLPLAASSSESHSMGLFTTGNSVTASGVEELQTALTFAAVDPCRAVDTRLASGNLGPIPAGGTRKFYVWGSDVQMQNGGVPTDCPAPGGEPLGVHLNVTVVPAGKQGNLRVYPANIPTPNSALVNYKPGVNIANAASVKTFASFGPEEIEVFSSQEVHIIIDVLGYYYSPVLRVGMDYAGGDALISLSASPMIVESVSVSAPIPGYVAVTATANAIFDGGREDVVRCSISPASALDFSHLVLVSDGDLGATTGNSLALTRGTAVAQGVNTFNLVCDAPTGIVYISDPAITAVFVPNRY